MCWWPHSWACTTQVPFCTKLHNWACSPRGRWHLRGSGRHLAMLGTLPQESSSDLYEVCNDSGWRPKAPEQERNAGSLSIEMQVFNQQWSDTLCFCDSELPQHAHQSRTHKIRHKPASQKSSFVQSFLCLFFLYTVTILVRITLHHLVQVTR